MKSLKGKKLLVLGGSASNVQLVKYAQDLGAYVCVADNKMNRPAKEVANEQILISTDDYEALCKFISENSIDGVATGAGEWNVINAMRLCKMSGLNYYANEYQWNYCQDKRNFKDLCKKFNVPIVPEYSEKEKLKESEFPVIVKPVDGCSSRGISICYNQCELEEAIKNAKAVSASTNVIIERYIVNGGITIDAKYVVIDGNFYLEALGERYVLNNGLITAISFYPSAFIDSFKSQVEPYLKAMFDSIGFNNGVLFFQAIPDGDNIYIYEMGLRVSGGMIYNMTEATGGNNAMKMLIYHSLTGKMCENEDINKIDPYFRGKKATTLSLPLRPGLIKSIIGLEKVRKFNDIVDITIYYHEGDEILPKHLNTLDQLFARIMIVSENMKDMLSILNDIRNTVSIKDDSNNEMIIWDTFDLIYKQQKNYFHNYEG